MKSKIVFLSISLCLLSSILVASEQLSSTKVSKQPLSSVFEPSSRYLKLQVHDIEVLVSPAVQKNKRLQKQAIKRLTIQIESVKRLLPCTKLAALKPIRIWVELNARANGYAEYHAYESWLIDNHRNPDKFRGIEISNINNYLKWSSQDPLISSVLVHEIAHAYFHSLTEVQRNKVSNAYLNASKGGLYRNVFRLGSHYNGRPVPIRSAWALTDEWEYFSELSESLFAKNDYFPHTAKQLEKYDPQGFQLVKSLWQ